MLNLGIWTLVLRERCKRKNRKYLSINTKYRDGVTRSSDETFVIKGGAKGLHCLVLINQTTRNRRI